MLYFLASVGTGSQTAWGWDLKFSMPAFKIADEIIFKWVGAGEGLVLRLDGYNLQIQPLWNYHDPKDVSLSLEVNIGNDKNWRSKLGMTKLREAINDLAGILN